MRVTVKPGAVSEGQVEQARWAVQKKVDRIHDGHFLGADGRYYPPSTPIDEVPPLLPDNGKEATELIVEVNGILTPGAVHMHTMQALANTGAAVIGIHNATSGMLADLTQTLGDKLNLGKNPAVDTATKVIWDALQAGTNLHLVAHSQGASILSRALSNVQNRMVLEQGLTLKQAQAKLACVTVETFGGSAESFINGPKYAHYVNRYDMIPWATGIGASKHHPFSSPGDGAVMHVFSAVKKPHDLPPWRDGLLNLFARAVDRTTHGPADVYYEERK